MASPLVLERVVNPATSVSTNDDAFALLDHCRTCLIWTTDQTGGRGSRGRQWLAPKDHALALSVGLDHREMAHPKDTCYPILAGIALHEALTSCLPVQRMGLKWPNDLLLDGGKLAGILCESRWQDDRVQVVVGIGINLKHHPALDNLPKGYATLETCEKTPAAATLATAVATQILAWASSGLETEKLNQRWLQHSVHRLGQPLCLQAYGNQWRGTFDGLSHDGALLLREDSGHRREIRQSCDDFAILEA